jgi:DNA-binding transcriptional ArsR family regulator
METITLAGKRELDIYINPQRQNLLRRMKLMDAPVTPKALADQMGISASSVQHHLKKLLELGVVELDHTERVRGITASYYRVPPKVVRIGGLIEDENAAQRLALMQNALTAAFSGFSEYCKKGAVDLREGKQHGDMLSGIVRLKDEEARQLYGLIRAFLDAHEPGEGGGTPWEYALIAYPVREAGDA